MNSDQSRMVPRGECSPVVHPEVSLAPVSVLCPEVSVEPRGHFRPRVIRVP